MGSIFAKRTNALEIETGFELLARARILERQGKEIVHLEIGEPDFDTPQNIKEAAVKALREGYTHYVSAAGLTELREAIAEHISESRGVDVDPSEVVVTPGGKPIAFFSALACLEHGDEVICPNPGYPIFESVINFAGARPVPMPILEKDDFAFNCSEVAEKITNRTKMIILNSPSNPTGGILAKEDLAEIAECVTSRTNLLVLSDEVYDSILYEGKHESIISAPGMKERTILLNSFSKTYAMTGWRLGYGVMRKDIARKITRLMVSSNSCTCAFIQMAGVEALKGPQDEVKQMVEEFKRRREIIISGLNKIEGVSCRKPSATFYAFPNVKNLGMNSKQLSDFLLEDAGVALLPGTAFGKYGEGYLRLSFANSIENIDKALNRISKAVARI